MPHNSPFSFCTDPHNETISHISAKVEGDKQRGGEGGGGGEGGANI